MALGASIYYVVAILGFLDPLPPLIIILKWIYALDFTQPPLLHHISFSVATLASDGDIIWKPPNAGADLIRRLPRATKVVKRNCGDGVAVPLGRIFAILTILHIWDLGPFLSASAACALSLPTGITCSHHVVGFG